MKSIRSVHLAFLLTASLVPACDVTEDGATPTGPKLSITAPTAGAVFKDGQDVMVAYAVDGVKLAAAGTCGSEPNCGHVVATVDGTKCNPAMMTSFWSGIDSSFVVNFTGCTSSFWGSHQLNVELVNDKGEPKILDSRQSPVYDVKMVTAAPTYDVTVQKILAAKCAPCHTAGNAGGHNLASTYADAMKAVLPDGASDELKTELEPCTKKGASTIGACAPILVQNGTMPKGAGCSGDPTKDAAKPACLTAKEQAALSGWAATNLLQN